MTEAAVIERTAAGPGTIRRADLADLDAILVLEESGFDPASRWSADSWSAELTGADRCVLVADRRVSWSEPGSSQPRGSLEGRPAGLADPQGSGRALPTAAAPHGSRRVRATDTGLVGAATFQLIADVADLHRVVVAPEQRGRGLGRALVEAGLAWASGQGCRRVLLEVEHDNAPALALYLRLGFVELARRKDYYGVGRHALVMQREFVQVDDTAATNDGVGNGELIG